jgi:acetylornithine deacetylase/succinyl-diaminopimelate desuccinylase-like protein
MTTEVTNLLAKLITFETTSDRHDESIKCFNFIETKLSNLPFQLEKYSINGKESRLWRSPASSKKLLLNAHIDVVPAPKTLFTMTTAGDKLIGRGVADMKFAIASFITVVQKMYAEKKELPPVDILLTSDEEIGGMDGVGHFVKHDSTEYAAVIIPDGGDDWHIVEEAKGVLQIKISASGKSAHASRPWEGHSAADRLLESLQAIRLKFPESTQPEWKTTLNIGQIHVGTQTNQVSDFGTALLDIRYIPLDDPAEIIDSIRKATSNCEVELLLSAQPFTVDSTNPYVQSWAKLIKNNAKEVFIKETGASDGRYFSALGIPVILSKPRNGDIHSDNEWLDAPSFFHFNDILEKFILRHS